MSSSSAGDPPEWVLPEDSGGPGSDAARPLRGRQDQPSPGASVTDAWVLPEEEAEPASGATLAVPARSGGTVSTGPSGLLLGRARDADGDGEPICLRLFRPVGTRVMVAVPEYVTWLLAFRAAAVGAHISVITSRPQRWNTLVDAVRDSGAEAVVLGAGDHPAGAGLPYRPSLVVDDADFYDGVQARVGPWQATLVVQAITSSAAVFALRSCDLAIVAPWEGRVSEHVRRAYALTPAQVNACGRLAESDVVLARPRQVVTVSVPPTPTEYQQLFA